MTRIRPYLLTCCCTASLLLASGRATQLRAETPGAEPAVQEAPCAALGGPFAAIPGETAPSAGKQVGTIGAVPFEAGDENHIHIEVKIDGKYADPLSFINNNE